MTDHQRGTYAPQVGETFRECKHLTALSANGLAGRYVVDWFRSDSVGLIALCANCSAQTLLVLSSMLSSTP